MLDDAGRERELSRMLAGLADSDTALAHARELLEVARPARALATDCPAWLRERRAPRGWHHRAGHEDPPRAAAASERRPD